MEPHRRSGAGRREFGRLVLSSLVTSARDELEQRRLRGQRLRARRAERRLAELEQALDRLERGIAPLPHPWYAHASVVTGAWVLLAAALAVVGLAVARNGPSGVLVGVADVALLLAALLWFVVAVARRTASRGRVGHPPNGGSTSSEDGR